MEGLEQLGTHMQPTCGISVDLPLRINTSSTPSTTLPPWHHNSLRRPSTAKSSPPSKHTRQSSKSLETKSPSPPHSRRSHSPSHSLTTTSTSTSNNHHRIRRHRPLRSHRHTRHPSLPHPPLHIRPLPNPLLHSITHLRTPLVPLISVLTGLPHPQFPTSLLQYHLLTHAQLDSLARWYHQTLDAGSERWMYPAPVDEGKAWTLSNGASNTRHTALAEVELEAKRRRWGRFIGLRGCESPVVHRAGEGEGDVGVEREGGVEEEEEEDEEGDGGLVRRMERRWKEALRRAEEEERVREKIWRGRC